MTGRKQPGEERWPRNGILLYLLAGVVAIISVSAIALRVEPDTSKLGIGVTIVALTIMPVLSRAKLKNATLHVRWVDPLAALVAIPIIVVETRRALRGEVCGCC